MWASSSQNAHLPAQARWTGRKDGTTWRERLSKGGYRPDDWNSSRLHCPVAYVAELCAHQLTVHRKIETAEHIDARVSFSNY